MRSKDSAVLRAKWPTRQRAWGFLRIHSEGITPLEAGKLGHWKLASYISDLIAAGYPIDVIPVKKHRTVLYKIRRVA